MTMDDGEFTGYWSAHLLRKSRESGRDGLVRAASIHLSPPSPGTIDSYLVIIVARDHGFLPQPTIGTLAPFSEFDEQIHLVDAHFTHRVRQGIVHIELNKTTKSLQ